MGMNGDVPLGVECVYEIKQQMGGVAEALICVAMRQLGVNAVREGGLQRLPFLRERLAAANHLQACYTVLFAANDDVSP